jgi:hypothetical protein
MCMPRTSVALRARQLSARRRAHHRVKRAGRCFVCARWRAHFSPRAGARAIFSTCMRAGARQHHSPFGRGLLGHVARWVHAHKVFGLVCAPARTLSLGSTCARSALGARQRTLSLAQRACRAVLLASTLCARRRVCYFWCAPARVLCALLDACVCTPARTHPVRAGARVLYLTRARRRALRLLRAPARVLFLVRAGACIVCASGRVCVCCERAIFGARWHAHFSWMRRRAPILSTCVHAGAGMHT